MMSVQLAAGPNVAACSACSWKCSADKGKRSRETGLIERGGRETAGVIERESMTGRCTHGKSAVVVRIRFGDRQQGRSYCYTGHGTSSCLVVHAVVVGHLNSVVIRSAYDTWSILDHESTRCTGIQSRRTCSRGAWVCAAHEGVWSTQAHFVHGARLERTGVRYGERVLRTCTSCKGTEVVWVGFADGE